MPPDFHLELPRDPSAATIARRAIRRHLGDALDAQRAAELALVVTELVTNAVRHGRGEISLRIHHDGTVVRGEIVDEGGGFEREIRERGADEIGGRGLLVVETLCERWGIHEGTTHVWFELPADQPAGSAPADPQLGERQRPSELGPPDPPG